MDRNSTVVGTSGINYLLFKTYEHYNEVTLRTERRLELPVGATDKIDIDMDTLGGTLQYQGKDIFTREGVQLGLRKLPFGTYAMVVSAGVEEDYTLISNYSINKFFARTEQVYIAETYQSYQVVALGISALEGTCYSQGNPPHSVPENKDGSGASEEHIYRSRTKKIVLPDSIKVLDKFCLNAHNYLEELKIPKIIYFAGSYIIRSSNLKRIEINELQDAANFCLHDISVTPSSATVKNVPHTEVYIHSFTKDINLFQGNGIAFPTTISKLYCPAYTISHLDLTVWQAQNLADSLECRVQGNTKMSGNDRPVLNSRRVKTISFSCEASQISYLPLFGEKSSDLESIYIEGTPILQSNTTLDSMFNASLTNNPIIYFSSSKEDIKRSLGNINDSQLNLFLGGRTATYNYIPPTKIDLDFIGFTYNGLHSVNDLKIYRTSTSNRYLTNIKNASQEKTQRDPNVDGTLYFYSQVQNNSFNISFAFDSLYEEDIRLLKRTFDGKDVHELIFDEEPYKVYEAKVTGTPNIKYIPFDDDEHGTIYKGEGSVTFTCYYPYAHTPYDLINGVDGRYPNHYFNSKFDIHNKFATYWEWIEYAPILKRNERVYTTSRTWSTFTIPSSEIKFTYIRGQEKYHILNKGEVPAPFKIQFVGYVPKNTTIQIDDQKLRIDESCYNLIVNTKTGQITGQSVELIRRRDDWQESKGPLTADRFMYGNILLSNSKAIKYTGSPFLTIPVSKNGARSILSIAYDSSYDLSAHAFRYIGEGEQGANKFVKLLTDLLGDNEASNLIIHGLNFMYGERKLDFQFWYY